MVLNYSRIALAFYRTVLKNYSETVLDIFLNIYGTVVERYMEHYFVLVKVLKICSRKTLELENF